VIVGSSIYFIVDLVTTSTPAIPYSVIGNGQGAVYEWQNDVITVRLNGTQTQGMFTLTEDVMKPTFKLGLHLHRKHAETFHILEGEVEFRLGTRTFVARPGTTVHAPPNTPHAVQRVVNGKQARMIMLYSPSGIESFLKEMKTFTDAQFADQKFMKTFNEKYDNIQLE
jgi:quercetin dioxygenase-like cupin family protein